LYGLLVKGITFGSTDSSTATFSYFGASVANLTGSMTKFLLRCGALTLVALPLPLLAQSWSMSGGVGPFAFGAGVGWWVSNRFAVEGQVADMVTASPFGRSDFVAGEQVAIPKLENVHITAGLRWKF
jgi:hypothetical protein